MSTTAHAHAAPPPNLFTLPVVAALLTEALALVGEGIAAAEIEAASLEAGMPVGLLATIDATSLDAIDEALHAELHALEHGEGHGHDHGHAHGHDHAHGHGHGHGHDHGHDHDHDHDHGHAHDHAHGTHHAHDHGHAPAPAPHRHAHGVKSKRMPETAVYVVEKMAHGFRRTGRAAGGGFYDYSSDAPQLWSGLKTFERRGRALPRQDVLERLRHIAVLASLGQAVAPASTSLGPVFGALLPTDAEAARTFVSTMGQAAFVARSTELAARFGDRFAPSAAVLARIGAA